MRQPSHPEFQGSMPIFAATMAEDDAIKRTPCIGMARATSSGSFDSLSLLSSLALAQEDSLMRYGSWETPFRRKRTQS